MADVAALAGMLAITTCRAAINSKVSHAPEISSLLTTSTYDLQPAKLNPFPMLAAMIDSPEKLLWTHGDRTRHRSKSVDSFAARLYIAGWSRPKCD